jgi:hypothetical protein
MEIKFKVIKKLKNELKLDRFGKKIYSFRHAKENTISQQIVAKVD